MGIVFTAVIGIVALVALVATFLCIKNWHWAQMLLMLGIFLGGLGALFLSAETLRIHRALRQKLPRERTLIEEAEEINLAFRNGTENAGLIGKMFRDSEKPPFGADVESIPGIDTLARQVKQLTRQRGRVWRGVRPSGPLANDAIPVAIPQPSPHGMPPEAIVFAFEIGLSNGPNPSEGTQYLGQFKVVSVTPDGAVLSPIQQLDQRTGSRLERSKGPWSVYETMPDDRHELYAELNEQQLRQLLPPATVEEYLRHGGPANADDDEYHTAGFDEEGNRLGPDEISNAAEKRYDRPLRSYGYLFEELNRSKVVMQANAMALQKDISLVQEAQASAKKLQAYREGEKVALAKDLTLMKRDREAIEALSQKLAEIVDNAKGLLDQALTANEQLAQQLMLRQVGSVRPAAPAGGNLLRFEP
ncbi:hypothetical protein [Adhaeretor mobilis]|uniref:Uncharacterized protein n=1 Tax=Adhaeretor mobilis TaxID=1930276 RepID=A0A517N2M2_9BACT|nr:hypothetical protein [Adhaeretor mobilis]QDT01384.1 hypothetical protein HG15A2_47260 [Adhaeretor mobilis]